MAHEPPNSNETPEPSAPDQSTLTIQEETPTKVFLKMADLDRYQNERVRDKLARKREKKEQQAGMTKVRFIVCTLGLVSLAMSQMSRMVLNVSVPIMVDKRMLSKKGAVSSDGSCPDPNFKPADVSTLAPEPTGYFTEADQPERPSDLYTRPHLDVETTTYITDSPTFVPVVRTTQGYEILETTQRTSTIPPKPTTTEFVSTTSEAPISSVAPTTLKTTTTTTQLAFTSPPPRPIFTTEIPVTTTREPETTESTTRYKWVWSTTVEPISETEDSWYSFSSKLPEITTAKRIDLDDVPNEIATTQTIPTTPEPKEIFTWLPLESSTPQTTSATTALTEKDSVWPFEEPTTSSTTRRSERLKTSTSTTESYEDVSASSRRAPWEREDDDDYDDDFRRKPKPLRVVRRSIVSNEFSTENATEEAPSDSSVQIDKFMWDTKQQQILLGAFYSSYFVFMIVGGRIAEMHGAKYVLLVGVAGSALINLGTPWMARNNFYMLVASRVVMGVIQSGVFPAMYALINKWLTSSEASIFAPLIKMNLRLGMFMGSALPKLVSDWPQIFYVTGVVCSIWSILWLFFATSTPQENNWVSKEELKHILKKKRKESENAIELSERNKSAGKPEPVVKKATAKTPWIKIITSPSVIGLVIVKLTLNFAVDFAAIELPSYLDFVYHASKDTSSTITSFMFGIQVFLIVFIGWLAKVMIKKRPCNISKTTIRKMFQGLCSFGSGICLLLLTLSDCNLMYTGVLLQVFSFLLMFAAGGETMLPYDLSDQYPATIMAIANSIANLSGVTTASLTGLILGGQSGSFERWNIVLYLIGGGCIVGGLSFLILVQAEPIDFGRKNKDEDVEAVERPNGGGSREPSRLASESANGASQLKPPNGVKETQVRATAPPSYEQTATTNEKKSTESAKKLDRIEENET